MKIFIRNLQRQIKTNQKKISSDSEKLLKLLGIHNAELSILLVNDKEIRKLNLKYRRKDETTDVLSFPLNEKLRGLPFLVLGDIAVNLNAARRDASEQKIALKEHLRWLLAHGILHLLGYDHEKSKYAEKKMRLKEKKILAQLKKGD
jgi:rRNA maturation RNase YbeY